MTSWTYVVAPLSAGGAPSEGDVAPLAPQSDHGGVAVERLLEEFHDLPRMEAMVRDLVELLQPLEDLAWQLLRERYLFAVDGYGPAVGEQLDGLGAILGEPRAGRVDDEYRDFLQVRILVNNSDGTWPDLHAILDLLPLVVQEAEELWPAHIWIEATGALYGYQAWRYLREAKAAGVGLTMILSSYDASDVFTLSAAYGAEQSSATLGLGGEYVSTGGRLTGVGR